PPDADTMIALCATYTHHTTHGLIAPRRAPRRRQVARLPRPSARNISPQRLAAAPGRATPSTRIRSCPRRRTAPVQAATVSPAIPPDAQPSIEIRELKIYANG